MRAFFRSARSADSGASLPSAWSARLHRARKAVRGRGWRGASAGHQPGCTAHGEQGNDGAEPPPLRGHMRAASIPDRGRRRAATRSRPRPRRGRQRSTSPWAERCRTGRFDAPRCMTPRLPWTSPGAGAEPASVASGAAKGSIFTIRSGRPFWSTRLRRGGRWRAGLPVTEKALV